MVNIYYDGIDVSDSTITPELAHGQLSLTWPYYNLDLYTVVMYDLDAPYPDHPVKSPFIHMLIVNIPGNDLSRGDVIYSYVSPNPPPDSPPHIYMVDLFKQEYPTSRLNPSEVAATVPSRERLNIFRFRDSNNLLSHGARAFKVSNAPSNTPVFENGPKSIPVVMMETDKGPVNTYPVNTSRRHQTGHDPIIMPNTQLDEGQQKFCACIIKAAAKEPEECIRQKEWYKNVTGLTGSGRKVSRRCASPYAVCAKTVGTTSPDCTQAYNFANMNDDELAAYAELHDIPISRPLNREAVLNQIKSTKTFVKPEQFVSLPNPGQEGGVSYSPLSGYSLDLNTVEPSKNISGLHHYIQGNKSFYSSRGQPYVNNGQGFDRSDFDFNTDGVDYYTSLVPQPTEVLPYGITDTNEYM